MHLVRFTIESSVSCVQFLAVGWGRQTYSSKWCIAPRSTEASRRLSLLLKCHTASRYTVKCSFFSAHKESVAFLVLVLQTRDVLLIFARTFIVTICKDGCNGCAVQWRHGLRHRTVRVANLCVRHIYIYMFRSSLQSMFKFFPLLR